MKILRIEPSSWYVGMKDTILQLMLTGEDINNAEITVCYPGIYLLETVRSCDSHYLFLYLDTAGCEAGTMLIRVSKGGETVEIPYVLMERSMHGEDRKSLSPADVVYLLMPDRFAKASASSSAEQRGKAFHPSARCGGDLEGIRTHLSYLSDLGVTALWLTPVLHNNMPETNKFTSYHGYAVTDFYAIDPRFGTLNDYLHLVRDAHSHNLKVVMDFIFNHCGAAHPWLARPPMPDWFNHRDWLDGADLTGGRLPETNGKYLQTNYRLTTTVDPYASEVDKRQTIEGWFVKSMPDLNLRNPHLLRYLTQCTIYWIETAGIDAIRMDTFPYADKEAMQRWLKALHREYPHFKVIGETWVTDTAFAAKWQEGELDSSMDFALFEALNMSKEENSDEFWSGMNRVYHALCYDYLYREPQMVMSFIDNHDVNRFLGDFDTYDSLRQQRLIACMKCALALLLTVPRLPQLYYGTEVLMHGTTAVSDGYVRRPFPGGFSGDTNNAFTSAGRTDEQNRMYRWLRRILHWRRGCNIVAYGDTRQFLPHNGIYVVARIHHEGTVLTVVNGNDHAAIFTPSHYSEVINGAPTARDVTTGRNVNLAKPMRMSPRKVMILELPA